MTTEINIETMTPDDWPRVREIYLEGIATGNATFEQAAPEWDEWDAGHLKRPRLIAHDGDSVVGWAAVSPVSGRCVYGGVAEVSVYVASNSRGCGIGKRVLNALIDSSEQNEIWTLQAGIFPENEASIRLHLACGFREVGRRTRIGKMNGVWRDTVLLERRSEIIGVD